ncbi:MAG TPA: O-antigen ligase family protein [Planctomycetota bacterium]|nr:O-antigen ligase family protein [Planctomycetota bacterium]
MELSLRLVFMALFTPAACLVSLSRPFWGLLALVAMYYFRPEIWGAPTWFRPQMWLTVAVGLGWIAQAKSLRFSTLMALATFIVAAFFLTAPIAAESSTAAYDGAVVVMKLVIVMLLTLNLVDTPRKMTAFLWTNVLGFVYNLKAVYLAAGSDSLTRSDVGVGQGGGSNYIAMVCAMAFAVAYVRFLHGRRRERRWAVAMMIAYVLAIVVTGSRAGYLSLAAVGGFFVLRSRKKALGFAAMAGVAVLFFLVVPQAHLDRFKQGFGVGAPRDPITGSRGRQDFSAKSRTILWFQGAVPMFREHPLTGVGIDNFPLLSPQYVGFYAGRNFDPYVPGVKKRGFVAHSTWFQLIAEGGVLVSVPFFLLFPIAWAQLARVRRSRSRDPGVELLKEHAFALQGVLLAFVVSSTFGSHLKMDFLWWYLGAVSCVHLMTLDAERRERHRAHQAERERIAASRTAPAGAPVPEPVPV